MVFLIPFCALCIFFYYNPWTFFSSFLFRDTVYYRFFVIRFVPKGGQVMSAKVGEAREVPGPKAQELLKDVKQHCITAVQEDFVMGSMLGSKQFEGVFVYDADGNEYLDFFAGAGVSNLGHNPWEVRTAVSSQLTS